MVGWPGGFAGWLGGNGSRGGVELDFGKILLPLLTTIYHVLVTVLRLRTTRFRVRVVIIQRSHHCLLHKVRVNISIIAAGDLNLN